MRKLHLLLMSALLLSSLAPDCLAARANGTMQVSVRAMKTALVTGGEEKLHWVLAQPPKPEDVAPLTDETFRSELATAFRQFAARQGTGDGRCLQLAVETRASPPECSLWDALRKIFAQPRMILVGDTSSPDPLKNAPTAEGSAPETRQLKFSYVTDVKTVFASGFTLELETAYAQAAAATGNKASILSRPLNIPPDRLPAQFAGNVSVTAFYAPQDRYPSAAAAGTPATPPTDVFTDEQVASALTEVAIAALRAAAEKQLTPDAIPDPSQAAALATQIESDWGMNPGRTLWPAVSASVRSGTDGNVLIHISGLRLVRGARINLIGNEVAVNIQNQSKLDAIRQAAADKVGTAHRDLLDGLNGKVPRLEPAQKIIEQIGRPKEVEGPIVLKSKDGVLLYEGNFRWVISALDAKIDLMLGLNPQERFTAGGSISGAKLFYLVPRLFGRPAAGNLGEAHSLTAKGGADYQTIDYTLSREMSVWSGTLLPNLDMNWKRDTEQRFGPGFQPVPEELARSIRPGITWTQHMEAVETPWSRNLSFDLGLPLRHTRLIPKTSGAADLVNAQITALSFEMRLSLGYDFSANPGNRKGVRLQAGRSNLQLHTDSRRGWQFLRGDYTFSKHAVDLDALLPWGLTMPDQFQLRYRRGAGTGTRSTPVFELFRLGGNDSLRGMESGEFVGRNLSFEQVEFGYNLFEPIEVFAKLLSRRKSPASGSTAPPTPGAPTPAPAADAPATPHPTADTPAAQSGISSFLRQNGISTLLVQVAHDRGLVTDSGRGLGDLFSLQHAAHAWGVGLELGGLRTPAGTVSITFMRARSSASYVHDGAVWTTGVRMSF